MCHTLRQIESCHGCSSLVPKIYRVFLCFFNAIIFDHDLQENKLATFEKDMTTFTNELEAALLPVPRILQVRVHAAANISEDDQILGRPCDLWLSKGLREVRECTWRNVEEYLKSYEMLLY